ncbi:MAG: serine/threonine protein kinase, partial [Acidobacteria bacterium]|nr:serine/threonine protein kinase [Acidobacteriota bacterium]
DIKPENVMLRGDGLVKVLDFGIAKLGTGDGEAGGQGATETTVAPSLTLAGAVVGTPDYLAPEQARGAQVDKRTDIFSFGILLAELLAGRHPLADKSAEAKLAALVSADELAVLAELPAPIPAALGVIVARAVRKRPDDRYDSAEELWEALKELNPPLPGRLAEAPGAKGARRWVRVQQANRLLNQYVALAALDAGTRLPFSAWWTAWRASEFKSGKLERALLRKSLFNALGKWAAWAALVAAITFGVAALLSRAEQWQERILHDGHQDMARALALAPDGRTLVTVGNDNAVIVWDVARGERRATLLAHSGPVSAVAFSPDGQWFASASSEGRTIVWDALCLTQAAVLPAPHHGIETIAFTPNGRWLAASGPANLLFWEVGTWRNIVQLPSYSPKLFSPDSRALITGDWQSLEWMTGKFRTSSAEPSWSYCALAPDAARLATVDNSGFVGFWDVSRFWSSGVRKLLGRYPAHRDHGRAVAYSPDGRLVATGSENIIVWDAQTQAKLARFVCRDIVTGLAFTRDSKRLISTHGDGAIMVWDIAEQELAANFAEHSGVVRSVSFSPDGQMIASASEDRSIILWDAASGLKRGVLSGQGAPLAATAFSADGRRVVASDIYGRVLLWDATTRALLRSFAPLHKRESDLGYCVTLSPDQKWVATTFGVYALEDGRVAVDFAPLKDSASPEIHSAAFSPDGKWLACVATGGHVYLWEVGSWRFREAIVPNKQNLVAVAFAPDSQRLATGENSGALRLWQVAPLQDLGFIGRHKANVEALSFAPDGGVLASASDDETVALWDVARRRFLGNVGTHKPSVLSVAFAPDGKRLVTGEHDNSVRVYTRQRTLWGWRLD